MYSPVCLSSHLRHDVFILAEDFQRYALDMPEVVSLFTTYLKMKESGHQFESAQSPEIGHPGSLENGQPGSSEDISTNEKKTK